MKKTVIRSLAVLAVLSFGLALVSCGGPTTGSSSAAANSSGTSSAGSFANNSGNLFSITIPAGTTRVLDIAVIGVPDATLWTYSNGTKFSIKTTVNDKATDTIVANAQDADAGYKGAITVVTGDVAPANLVYGSVGNGSTFYVDVLTKPNVTDGTNNLYGICGTFSYTGTTAAPDATWNGGSNVLLNTFGVNTTNAQGYFSNRIVFTVGTNSYTIEARQGTNNLPAGINLDPTHYGFKPTIPAGNTTNITMIADWSVQTLSQTTVLNIQLNIAAYTNSLGMQLVSFPTSLNLKGDATGGAIGDMWVSGQPATVFGDYSDTLSTVKITNYNTQAWARN
jgi:hypothetical protein